MANSALAAAGRKLTARHGDRPPRRPLAGCPEGRRARCRHLFDHPLHGAHPATAVDLLHVLAGEAEAQSHQQQQHLIESAALAIDHMAIHHPVRSPLLTARAAHNAAPRGFSSRP